MRIRVAKIVPILLAVVSIVLGSCTPPENSSSAGSVIGSAASSQASVHEHTFSSLFIYNDTHHWHPSTCGHDVQGGRERHDFVDEVIEPTYESGGYTIHTCSVCGYSYKDERTDKLIHEYSSEWSYGFLSHWHACVDEGYENLKADEESHSFIDEVVEPSFESGGYTIHTCSVCGYSYQDEETDPLAITVTWTDYDGTILEQDFDVPYGSMPSYDGKTPSRESPSDAYGYVFAGWSPEVVSATEDANYVAQYDVIHNETNLRDFIYEPVGSGEDRGVRIVSYIGKDQNVAVPDFISLDGVDERVTEIGDRAFYDNDAIVSVAIPDTVVSIGAEAFSDCLQLSNVALRGDGSLERIGDGAFSACISLPAFELPTGLVSIGNRAFAGCIALRTVGMDEEIALEAIGGYAFQDCSSLSFFTIPDGLTTIDEYTFSGCSFLPSISIPNTVTSIRKQAFSKCTSLQAVTFEEDSRLTVVEDHAFFGCSSLSSVSIPDGVISLGEYAFSECTGLISAIFGGRSKLVSIGQFAFAGCGRLVSAYVPRNVSSIGDYAFRDSPRLTIYCGAASQLAGWSAIWNYNVPDVIWNIDGFGSYLGFIYAVGIDEQGERYVSIVDYSGSVNNIAIPNLISVYDDEIPVTTIGDFAFADCPFLSLVYIHDGVASIGSRAFYGSSSSLIIYCEAVSKPGEWDASWNPEGRQVIWDCKGGGASDDFRYTIYLDENGDLYAEVTSYVGSGTHVSIPESVEANGILVPVESIAESIFESNVGLTSVSIPASVASIGDYAFSGCSALASVSFGDGSQLKSIGSHAFYNCTSLASIAIPDDVSSICDHAFDGCSNLASVSFGNGSVLETIGDYAFSGCTSLASASIPDSVASIGSYAFDGCTELESVSFGSGSQLESIGNHAFDGCSSLESVFIPGSVASIGDYAFSGCSSLASVSFGDGSQLKSIGDHAFYNCTSLASIAVPDDVSSICDHAFSGCTSLASVSFGDGSQLKSIGSHAFYNCTSLESIAIPASVASIGDYAFYGCSALASVSFGDGSVLESIGGYAFYNCASLAFISIPDGVTSISSYAFSSCSSLLSVFIPASVVTIRKYAFSSYNPSLVFYCEAASQPNGWDSYWAGYGPDVVWDCRGGGISDGFRYTIYLAENGEFYAEVTSYVGSGTHVSIPESIDVGGEEIPVKEIAESAFEGNGGLVSVSIPASVVSIGSRAFYGCSNLASVSFGNGSALETIDDHAFCNCSSLVSLHIPSSVTSIGSYAFSGCSSLASVYIPGSVASIVSYAFDGCPSLTVYCEAASQPNGWDSSWKGYGPDVVWVGTDILVGDDFAIAIRTDAGGEYVEIVRYIGTDRNVAIPDTISVDGKPLPVRAIGSRAFQECTSLASIFVPSSVASIGDHAFYWCSALATVSFGSGSQLESIGDYAFRSCSSLKSVHIPASVASIGEYAFYWCSALASVSFGSGSQLESIGDHAFRSCSSLKSVHIPASVASIGDYAFYNCTSLASIAIPSSVASIGDYAFSGCTELESVSFDDGSQLKSIGDYAFQDCTSLASIAIPSSVASIGEYAFYGCTQLESVSFDDGSQLKSIGDYAFQDCTSLKSVHIPASVVSIGFRAFYGCSNLASVSFGNGSALETIGKSAFQDCTSLKSVFIPDSVSSIGSYAFSGCITSIGYCAFSGCSSLESVYCEAASTPGGWDSSWLSYGVDVVWNSYLGIHGDLGGLEYTACLDGEGNPYMRIDGYTGTSADVAIPESIDVDGEEIPVKKIAESAFESNGGLISVSIPASVASIGEYAFYGCTQLESVSFGDGSQLKSIGSYAFSGCESLEFVSIPSSVVSISSGAFSGCLNLASVSFGNGSVLETIGDYAFSGCSSLILIDIPSSVISIGYQAFSACSSLVSTSIPDMVASIGDYAFSGCSSLASVYIPDTVASIGDYAFSGCSSLTVYCEAASRPSGWDSYWLGYDSNVVWNSYLGIHGNLGGLEYTACLDGDGNPYMRIEGYTGTSNDVAIPEFIDIDGEEIPVKEIGDSAFEDCSSLESVYIHSSVTSIGARAFYYCSSLTVYCEATSKPSGWDPSWLSYDVDVVWDCQGGGIYGDFRYTLYLGEDGLLYAEVSYIGSGTHVSIPESVEANGIVVPVEAIGKSAFQDCTSLKSVFIPDSVSSIGSYAFSGCNLHSLLRHIDRLGRFLLLLFPLRLLRGGVKTERMG